MSKWCHRLGYGSVVNCYWHIQKDNNLSLLNAGKVSKGDRQDASTPKLVISNSCAFYPTHKLIYDEF